MDPLVNANPHSSTDWTFYRDSDPRDPWFNMQRDAELFDVAVKYPKAKGAFRIYRWDRPCVTIGRLQSADIAEPFAGGLPVIRRVTGGRAVKHGSDLTASIIMSSELCKRLNDHSVKRAYARLIEVMTRAFVDIGIAATGGTNNEVDPDDPDCFARSAACDLVALDSGRKIVGTAQRRSSGAVIQQMSFAGRANDDEFAKALEHRFAELYMVKKWDVVDTAKGL